jgi:hypothetical protein
MLFQEIIPVYCKNHTEYINRFTLYEEMTKFLMLNQPAHIRTAVIWRVKSSRTYNLKTWETSGGYKLNSTSIA